MLTITLGLLASASLVLMSLSLSRLRILLLSLAINIFNASQYLLLGEMGAFAMGAVGLIMTIAVLTSFKVPALGGRKTLAFFLAAYPVTFLIANGAPSSVIDILPLFSTMIATCAVFAPNPIAMKAMFAANGASWLVFEISTGAWGAIPGEVLTLSGNLLALSWLIGAQMRGEPLAEVKEINTRIAEWRAARVKPVRTVTDFSPVVGIAALPDDLAGVRTPQTKLMSTV